MFPLFNPKIGMSLRFTYPYILKLYKIVNIIQKWQSMQTLHVIFQKMYAVENVNQALVSVNDCTSTSKSFSLYSFPLTGGKKQFNKPK